MASNVFGSELADELQKMSRETSTETHSKPGNALFLK